MTAGKRVMAVITASMILITSSCSGSTGGTRQSGAEESNGNAGGSFSRWEKPTDIRRETREVNGRNYTFTIDLTGWDGYTTEEQIGTISELFWEVYPAMYERFGVYSEAPTEVTLAIEDYGYEIAETAGAWVHLHDRWLYEWPDDYDCLTHEFAHVIQNGWDGQYLEYDSYIERFADFCRYEYAYDNGYYNDHAWTLQTVADEPDRETSVRFLVWLDCLYSTPDNDILLRYYETCYDCRYESEYWGDAWAYILDGSPLEDLTINEVFEMYRSSDFAMMSSYAEPGGESELESNYEVRN